MDQYHEYDQIISQQLESGVIELVQPEEQKIADAYYLPHRAVFMPDKSTKTRIVYNGSACLSKRELSLNNLIYTGCNLLSDLFAVVVCFQFNRIAIVSDIEKAFLQLSIAHPDRNYVQFLWFDKHDPQFAFSNVIVFHFMRVAFGIIASPFLLNTTVPHHITENPNEFTEQLKRDTFTDTG